MEKNPAPESKVIESKQARPRSRAKLAFIVALLLFFAGLLIPLPYVIEQPGPAVNVLGQYRANQSEKATPVIQISDHQTYPTSGKLSMTTVSVLGNPEQHPSFFQVVAAWFDRTKAVLPLEAVYPPSTNTKTVNMINAAEMTSSQQESVAVALRTLGISFGDQVIVGSVLSDGPAHEVLRAGDVILEVNGTAVTQALQARELSGKTPKGEKVRLKIKRNGQEQDVLVPTKYEDGRSLMGIIIVRAYDFPFQVKISLEDIGGPSAGTMFALGVLDKLTPEDLTGGKAIAGTGTINEKGEVGAIGGIRQKMVGAKRVGNDFFLAPAANCDEVVGYEPDGMQVFKVATFADAKKAVEVIGKDGDLSQLPRCSAADKTKLEQEKKKQHG